eukprot:CAMPEP_0201592576 /NCGR_PEP_ID=MMETSP0190_2-20130828/190439_1 /ASSEMBLY_ACC=CAM_ASM_000263 /TAXON_ID=37353 /ORGANISM="Rosalina sp." /LENGTH=453 /DNA_ID=CAMNT_0048051421 /DNA_START=2097 /DNA_END=3458 /DNA_ORIENTATION=-
MEIVHTGSDQVCIGSVKISGSNQDDGDFWNAYRPWCTEDPGGGGCGIIKITTGNDWSEREPSPCEFSNAQLRATYDPTPAPTNQPTPAPTDAPSDPTNTPTVSPTSPTKVPTVPPTPAPTYSPTRAPTDLPTVSPTKETKPPTKDPTKRPSSHPTDAPFQSANVDAPTASPVVAQKAIIGESEPGTVDYGLIFGILFGALFCCTLCLFLLYCWRTKKKQEDEVNRMNIEVGNIGVVAQHVPDASPMSVGDGNPTTFTGHQAQMSDIPQLPAETWEEGGESGTGGTGNRSGDGAGDGAGTGTNPGSVDYDDDYAEEPVVPIGSPDLVDEAGVIYSQDEEKEDMYQPALDIAAANINPDNQMTAGGDDDEEYEYYYEDENGNIVPDNGYGQSPGGDVTENANDDDDDSDEENEQYEMNEMYNKQRSTAKGNNKLDVKATQQEHVDSDVSENMYGL